MSAPAAGVKATPVGHVVRIPLARIRPGKNQRGKLRGITELAVSMRTVGQLEPVTVYDAGDGWYEVFEGHRRLAAAELLELPYLDAVLRARPGERERVVRQMAMHANSQDFDPIAQAEGIQALMFTIEPKMSREEIAEAMGRTPGWVRDRLALLTLSREDREGVRLGELPVSAALQIIRAGRRGEPAESPPPPAPVPARAAAVYRPAPARPRVRAQNAGHCPTCRCTPTTKGGDPR